VSILVSKNYIGNLAERIVQNYKIQFIRGSSRNPRKPEQDKGGSVALKQMVHILNEGGKVAITPDGPKGPAFTCKTGAILAAKKTKTPIIPLSFSSKWHYQVSSWDKFIVPLPFSRGHFIVGDLFYVSDSFDEEIINQETKQLEGILNELTQQADALYKA